MTLLVLLLPLIAGDCELCIRDKVTRAITRDSAAIRAFKKMSPCPATGKPTGACKGYVVDHIVPLACADDLAFTITGASTQAAIQFTQKHVLDKPENMQWQSHAASKAKDKYERKYCAELWADRGFQPK